VILLLDNYDSFTWNLVQYLSELGAEVVVFRNDEITVEEIRKRNPQGLVLSSGPGRPENAGIVNQVVAELSGQVPVLGVGLGHQAIAQVFGGVITYAPSLMHGKTSQIFHNHTTLFTDIPSPFVATRCHSLIVDVDSLPEEFRLTAWTDDGIVMAIEHVERPIYGVQFHPESIMTPSGKQILRNYLETIG